MRLKKYSIGQQAAWPALGFSQFYVDSDYICNSVELEQFTAARRSAFSQFPVTISLLAIVNPPVQLLVHNNREKLVKPERIPDLPHFAGIICAN